MSTALLTDRYELTMVQAALKSDQAQKPCVFEAFARSLPAGRRFGVVAGTARLMHALQDFRFGDSELEFLRTNQIVNQQTLDYLADFKFAGNITGYAEGELYFAHSPVVTVEASFAEGVLIETLLLSILNYDSAVASAAARMKIAAGDRYLAEMGARRANEQAAVSAARAAYLVGFDASSNLEAHRSYGIPSMGTSAHSFTLLFDTEAEAFKAQLESMGNNTTLLVDTYDIEQAVRKAVELSNGKVSAVRLDSGDLGSTAKKVRSLLDQLGAKQTKIVVTSDLDEYTIAALQSAPVDRYGVGTSLVTGSGYPTAGFVYKLVAHQSDSGWIGVGKLSEGKGSTGGKKLAGRLIENSVAQEEVVGSKLVGRPLQVSLMKHGEMLGPKEPNRQLELAREHHRYAISELPETALRLSKGDPAIPTRLV